MTKQPVDLKKIDFPDSQLYITRLTKEYNDEFEAEILKFQMKLLKKMDKAYLIKQQRVLIDKATG